MAIYKSGLDFDVPADIPPTIPIARKDNYNRDIIVTFQISH